MPDPEGRIALQRALIEEGFGPLGLVGTQAVLPWLPFISASASQLCLRASAQELEALRYFGGASLGIEVEVIPEEAPAEASLAGLLVLDWPEGDDPLRGLEAMLSRVGDRGLCLFDMPVDAAREARLLRLFEGMLTEATFQRSASGHLVGRGLRDAPGRELALDEPEPIDLTVLLYARGDSHAANATALDLLFRQNFPPHLVLVLDDAKGEETAVPEDLWGMAPHAQTQPGLLRCEGQGRAAALARAFEFVETDLIVWVEAGDRLAANHGGALLAEFYAEDETRFVHASSWRRGTGAAAERIDAPPAVSARALVGAWAAGPRPPLAALAWSAPADETEEKAWREVLSSVAEDADAAVFSEALAMRLALAGGGRSCAWPLVITDRELGEDPSDDARRALRRGLRDHLELGRLALRHESKPRALRRVLALRDRALYLAGVGEWELALEDFDEAEALAPADTSLGLWGVTWSLRRGDRDAAAERARERGEEGAWASALLDAKVRDSAPLRADEARFLRLVALGGEKSDLRALADLLFADSDSHRALIEAWLAD
jgi:hypothetical protein